jgi:hypothetical protein
VSNFGAIFTKKAAPAKRFVLTVLGCFRDSAGSDAVRANPQTLMSLADKNPDSLKVGIPASLRQIMGVADPMSVNWTFIADFTTCHEGDLP